MRHRFDSVRLPYLLLAALLAACSKSPSTPPPPPAAASPAPARDIALRPDQVRFDRTAIATIVRVERRPASRLPAHPEPNTRVTPAHLLVILDPATLPDPAWPEARSLIVYAALDWSRAYAWLGRASDDPVPLLVRTLRDKPQEIAVEFPSAGSHPGARQIVRSAVKYFEFHDGRGVRFLTVNQADPLPVADRDVVYVFHGLTNDGRYWVTLNFPVNARVLPAPDAALAQLSDYDQFIAGHAKYIADLGRTLNAARPEDFTPRLDRIDAMLASLAITD